MSLISLLVLVLIVCVIIWATRALTTAFGVTDPIRTVIYVVVTLICLLYVLDRVGLFSVR